jgi:hypothetical protein
MSHSIHTHVEHAEDVGHDDANGVAAITARYVAELEKAGHEISHHHVIRHHDGHVVAHKHHTHD